MEELIISGILFSNFNFIYENLCFNKANTVKETQLVKIFLPTKIGQRHNFLLMIIIFWFFPKLAFI